MPELDSAVTADCGSPGQNNIELSGCASHLRGGRGLVDRSGAVVSELKEKLHHRKTYMSLARQILDGPRTVRRWMPGPSSPSLHTLPNGHCENEQINQGYHRARV